MRDAGARIQQDEMGLPGCKIFDALGTHDEGSARRTHLIDLRAGRRSVCEYQPQPSETEAPLVGGAVDLLDRHEPLRRDLEFDEAPRRHQVPVLQLFDFL